jgi:hypothetical protein
MGLVENEKERGVQVTEERPRAAKRLALNMKATPELRRRVEIEADRRGLSIAQEVERTLLETYNRHDVAGDRDVDMFVYVVAATARKIIEQTGHGWLEDRGTFEQVRGAIDFILDTNAPPLITEDADQWEALHRQLEAGR